jgi:hypothetical protein
VDPNDKGFWLLTGEQYGALVDARMKEIGETLKRRWARGEIKKGRCILTDRDFVKEREEEIMDSEAYNIIQTEKSRREKLALGFAP